MNRIEAVKYFAGRLKELGLDEREATAEARFMFSSILDCDLSELYLKGQAPVTEADEYRAREMLRRRSTGEPLAYILREKWFMGLRLRVTPAVLIPRPETELLCETAIQLMRLEVKGSALDICTGSGCIAISLAKYTRARVTGADISPEALEIAQLNAKINLVKASFIESDLFSGTEEKFDVITANPPYIRTADIDTLMMDVRDYEPRLALDGGRDGLSFYRRIAAEAPAHLKKAGVLIMEMAEDQAEELKDILSGAGFSGLRVIRDLAGLDRVIVARS